MYILKYYFQRRFLTGRLADKVFLVCCSTINTLISLLHIVCFIIKLFNRLILQTAIKVRNVSWSTSKLWFLSSHNERLYFKWKSLLIVHWDLFTPELKWISYIRFIAKNAGRTIGFLYCSRKYLVSFAMLYLYKYQVQ